MNNKLVPKHVGIILDGNGRWAKEQGKNRSYGHKKGLENLKVLAKYIFDQGIEVLSVYAFSTENFKRSNDEVSFLMNLFINEFEKGFEELINSDIRIVFSGQKKEPLPRNVIKVMEKLEDKTKDNRKGIFNICLNYGGHVEIIDATKKILMDVKENKLNINDLDEEVYNKYLYQDLPLIDFLIRTSGEIRISNFMLWQLSYAEFYFPKVYFPDFTPQEFDKAMVVFQERNRRYGDVK